MAVVKTLHGYTNVPDHLIGIARKKVKRIWIPSPSLKIYLTGDFTKAIRRLLAEKLGRSKSKKTQSMTSNPHNKSLLDTREPEGAGKLVTIPTAKASGTVTFDETTNPVWTASGGFIIARFAVIFNDSHASNQAVCVCLMDTTPADVTATTGNTLTITINASGLFTLSGAAVD